MYKLHNQLYCIHIAIVFISIAVLAYSILCDFKEIKATRKTGKAIDFVTCQCEKCRYIEN